MGVSPFFFSERRFSSASVFRPDISNTFCSFSFHPSSSKNDAAVLHYGSDAKSLTPTGLSCDLESAPRPDRTPRPSFPLPSNFELFSPDLIRNVVPFTRGTSTSLSGSCISMREVSLVFSFKRLHSCWPYVYPLISFLFPFRPLSCIGKAAQALSHCWKFARDFFSQPFSSHFIMSS